MWIFDQRLHRFSLRIQQSWRRFPSDALAQYEQNQLRLAYFRPFSFADKQNQCFKDAFGVYFLLWLAFVTIRQFVFVNL